MTNFNNFSVRLLSLLLKRASRALHDSHKLLLRDLAILIKVCTGQHALPMLQIITRIIRAIHELLQIMCIKRLPFLQIDHFEHCCQVGIFQLDVASQSLSDKL